MRGPHEKKSSLRVTYTSSVRADDEHLLAVVVGKVGRAIRKSERVACAGQGL